MKYSALHRRGFTLLIAIIFMSVVLALGLAIGSLGYKQELLAASVLQSQDAFYAADTGLECALYEDEQKDSFNFNTPAASMDCDGVTATVTHDPPTTYLVSHVRMNVFNGARCVDITVYKPDPAVGGTTYLFAQGYSVTCGLVATPGGARIVARGIQYHY